MADLGGLLQGLASVLWVVFALVVFMAVRPAIEKRLADLTKLGLPGGVSMEFAERKLDEAAQDTAEEVRSGFGEASKNAVLARMSRNADLLARARVLWADDHPENNRSIVDLLRAFGTVVETPRNNVDALALLEASRFDVVVSDVARDQEGPSGHLKGVELAEQAFERFRTRTILFTARFDPTSLPGATDVARLALARRVEAVTVGRTNRFPEALHLILDELERTLL